MAMSKGNDPSDAEDYLSHLQWHSRGGHGHSVRYEPKWKYKRVYTRWKKESPVVGWIFIGILLIAFAYILYQAIVMRSGLEIYISLVIGLALVILYFAVRDLKKSEAKSGEDTQKESSHDRRD